MGFCSREIRKSWDAVQKYKKSFTYYVDDVLIFLLFFK